MTETFDPDFAGVTDYAVLYRSLGLQAVPAMPPKPGEQWKRPAIKWRDYETVLADQATFDQWFAPRQRLINLGLITGRCSSAVINGVRYKLFVADMDTYKSDRGPQWLSALCEVHNNGMELETVTQRTGGGGLQMFFWVPYDWQAPTTRIADLDMDFRGDGGFIVATPSQHTSGNPYGFLPGRGPHEIEIIVAPDWLLDAIDALVAQYGGRAPQIAAGGQVSPIRTQTPQAQRTLSGRLLDGREAYMAALVWRAVCDLRDESPILADLTAERDAAYQRYEGHVASRLDPSQRHNMTDAQALDAEGRGKAMFDLKWASAIAQWDGKVKGAVAAREAAPEPFQVEYMDPETGEFVQGPYRPVEAPPASQAVTPSEQAPTPSTGLPEPITNVWDPWERFPVPKFPLDTLPAKVRAYVEVSARSTGGDVSACAMAALSVAGAAIDQSFRLKMRRGGNWEVPPLIWVMLFGDPSTKKTPILKSFMWALDKVEASARQQHQREVARWKADGGKKGDDNEPEKPTRYITSDATVEKIADILTRQDRGILLHKDELSGWLAALDGSKNGREAEKSFWTKAYNGNSHSIDRVLRGETFVSNLAVPVIGGMQPDEMAKIPDLTSNGLMQRFMPVVLRPAVKGQDVEDQQEAHDWETLVAYLSSLGPHMMLSSPSAMQVSDQFQDQCAAMERVAALGSKFTTFVGKLPGMHGALSLILHLIDGLWDEPVTGHAAARAERILSQFAVPHAMAFYGVSGDAGDVEQMRSIASYVLASDKDRFTPHDFAANSRSMRGLGMWELAKRLSPLVVNGWLEEEAAKGGGGVRAWVMRPGVREALAARREEQQAQRRQVAAMLAELRRSASEA
jgi:hypothetical protein